MSRHAPSPLRSRPTPPVIPAATRRAADAKGTVAVMNVYESDFAWPEDTRIKALRVVQLFPKTTPSSGTPRIGAGNQSLVRGVLGTVPVEADGSAHFETPTNVPLYFQALDAAGRADLLGAAGRAGVRRPRPPDQRVGGLPGRVRPGRAAQPRGEPEGGTAGGAGRSGWQHPGGDARLSEGWRSRRG